MDFQKSFADCIDSVRLSLLIADVGKSSDREGGLDWVIVAPRLLAFAQLMISDVVVVEG